MMISIFIRKIEQNKYFIIERGRNIAIECKIEDIYSWLEKSNFLEGLTVNCDQETFNTLTTYNVQNLKKTALDKHICKYLFKKLLNNTVNQDNSELYNSIKNYLVKEGDNKKRGANGIDKRVRPIIIELFNNKEFILDFQELWVSISKLPSNVLKPHRTEEKNNFLNKIKFLIAEILIEKDMEKKKKNTLC